MKLLTLAALHITFTTKFIPFFNITTKYNDLYRDENSLTNYYERIDRILSQDPQRSFLLPFISEKNNVKTLNVLHIKDISHRRIKDDCGNYLFGDFWFHVVEEPSRKLSSKNGKLKYMLLKYNLGTLELENEDQLEYKEVPIKIRFSIVPKTYDYWYIKYTIFDWNEDFGLNFFISYPSDEREYKFNEDCFKIIENTDFTKTENYIESLQINENEIVSPLSQNKTGATLENIIASLKSYFQQYKPIDDVQLYYKPFCDPNRPVKFYRLNENSKSNDNDEEIKEESILMSKVGIVDGDKITELRYIYSHDGSVITTKDDDKKYGFRDYFDYHVNYENKELKLSMNDTIACNSFNGGVYKEVKPIYSENEEKDKKEIHDKYGDKDIILNLDELHLGKTARLKTTTIEFDPLAIIKKILANSSTIPSQTTNKRNGKLSSSIPKCYSTSKSKMLNSNDNSKDNRSIITLKIGKK